MAYGTYVDEYPEDLDYDDDSHDDIDKNTSDDTDDDMYTHSNFWWEGGRGVRLCRRMFVEIERVATGVGAPLPKPARLSSNKN